MIELIRRYLAVVFHRFFPHGYIRLSEFVEIFADTIPKLFPARLVNRVYLVLDELFEKLLWM